MSEDDTTTTEAPTRREVIEGGGAVIGGGLLAGCAGQSGPSGGANDSNGSNSNTTTGGGNGSYSVTMAPMGEITFESVPTDWFAFGSTEVDMGFALGELDGLVGATYPLDGLYTSFYEELPGVSFDPKTRISGIYNESDEISKEAFYEADADVHLIDSNYLNARSSWDQSDSSEIAKSVAPFFGNYGRRPEAWHDYEYYTLYEHFEKYAQLFKKPERCTPLKEIHDRLITDVRAELPPESERPSVGYVGIYPPTVYLVNPLNRGYEDKQYRDLDVTDSFAARYSADTIEGETDSETLLEVDPDVLIEANGLGLYESVEQYESEVLAPLKDDPVASEVTAIVNDRIYLGGNFDQGPILNLFQTEMLAKQLYPAAFGE